MVEFVSAVIRDPSHASSRGRSGPGHRGRRGSGRAGTAETRTHSGEEKPSPGRPEFTTHFPPTPTPPPAPAPAPATSQTSVGACACACAGASRHACVPPAAEGASRAGAVGGRGGAWLRGLARVSVEPGARRGQESGPLCVLRPGSAPQSGAPPGGSRGAAEEDVAGLGVGWTWWGLQEGLEGTARFFLT